MLIEMIHKVCIIGSRIDVNLTEEDTGVLLEYMNNFYRIYFICPEFAANDSECIDVCYTSEI